MSGRAARLHRFSGGIPGQPRAGAGGVQEYVTGPGGRVVEIDLLPVAAASGTIQGTSFTTTQIVYVHADAWGVREVLTDPTGTPILGYSLDPYGQASATPSQPPLRS